MASWAGVGFEHPWALGLLASLAVPLYLWVLARRNYGRVASALPPLGKPPGPPLALLTVLSLLSLAAASPVVAVYERVPVTVGNVDRLLSTPIAVVVALDVSKSMGYREGGMARIDMARALLEKLLARLGNATVVLLEFAATARLAYSGPPEGALKVLEGVRAGGRYSAVGDAVGAAASYARLSGLPTVVLVVTDGGWNYGGDPVREAETAQKTGIPVVFIIVGSDPRGYRLEERLREAGFKVYRVDTLTVKALDSLVGEAAAEARVEALRAAGLESVALVRGRHSVAWLPGLAAAAILTLLLRRGV